MHTPSSPNGWLRPRTEGERIRFEQALLPRLKEAIRDEAVDCADCAAAGYLDIEHIDYLLAEGDISNVQNIGLETRGPLELLLSCKITLWKKLDHTVRHPFHKVFDGFNAAEIINDLDAFNAEIGADCLVQDFVDVFKGEVEEEAIVDDTIDQLQSMTIADIVEIYDALRPDELRRFHEQIRTGTLPTHSRPLDPIPLAPPLPKKIFDPFDWGVDITQKPRPKHL